MIYPNLMWKTFSVRIGVIRGNQKLFASGVQGLPNNVPKNPLPQDPNVAVFGATLYIRKFPLLMD